MTAIMSYKLGSASAKKLASALGARRVRPDGDFRNNFNHMIINWGSSTPPQFPTRAGIINKPEAVKLAVNKYFTLRRLTEAGVPTLVFYTSAVEAGEAVQNGKVIFARKDLTGRSGSGIIVIRDINEMVGAPLYTEFFDKKIEYRVHVAFGSVFDFQAKLKRNGVDADPYVFSYDNGRVFCRGDIELPPAAEQAAVDAVAALGLDFAALDIGVDEDGNVAVFEVNTSPALEGTTLERYSEVLGAIR